MQNMVSSLIIIKAWFEWFHSTIEYGPSIYDDPMFTEGPLILPGPMITITCCEILIQWNL